MHPILFIFSGIPIYASPVFLVLALIVGFFVGRDEILRREISLKPFYLYWVLAVPVTLFLAAINSALFHHRLFHVLSNPGELTSTGLVSFGAVIGTFSVGFIIAKIYKIPMGQILDVISITLPLILGVYRFGCILNGCCFGRETDGLLGVYLPNLSGMWANRYPTQIMLLAFDFALFFVLWRWRLKNPVPGKPTLVFLLSFSIFRLLLDSLREVPMVNSWLNILQMGSITILLITLYALIMIRLQKSSRTD
jgi:phosphatidylglycerol---prolipoprotein diacylglyceryl transferase